MDDRVDLEARRYIDLIAHDISWQRQTQSCFGLLSECTGSVITQRWQKIKFFAVLLVYKYFVIALGQKKVPPFLSACTSASHSVFPPGNEIQNYMIEKYIIETSGEIRIRSGRNPAIKSLPVAPG